ncbi:MAG: tRNA pseudouridine(55) synthase TruB [Desulfobacterales bacterium]
MQEINEALKQSHGRKSPAGPPSAGDGIIVVDKPAAITSAAVVGRIKRLAGITKTGHAGTLDPFATGVLICPINRATRLSRFFLHGRKKYAGVLRLGTETDTLDRTGRVVSEHRVPDISEQRIRDTVKGFVGQIQQVPPAYSALKHNGVPLYKYARAGTPVEKPPRTVEIRDIRVTHVALPDIEFEVSCSGGTYIRTLCADIGKALGSGGHLKELIRTESSGFTIKEAATLEDLEAVATPVDLAPFVIPMATALRGMPAHVADAVLAEKIRHGRQISAMDLQAAAADEDTGFVKITDNENRLLAVIEKNRDKSVYSYCCVFH